MSLVFNIRKSNVCSATSMDTASNLDGPSNGMGLSIQ